MICYKDRIYCAASCSNTDCSRLLTDEVRDAARKWWGKEGAPIACADMSSGCQFFRRVK